MTDEERIAEIQKWRGKDDDFAWLLDKLAERDARIEKLEARVAKLEDVVHDDYHDEENCDCSNTHVRMG